MKVHIIAVGRAKRGPETSLYDHYIARMRWPVQLHEVEEKKRLSGAELKAREAELLLASIPKGAVVVALDERGKAIGSMDFAAKLKDWEDQARAEIAFLIGGVDGLDESVRQAADLIINFGNLTWPHMLVRAMLVEQIYRAQQILAGHPYHRE